MTPRIVVIAGSTREHSFNKRLARLGAAAARSAGADVTEVDLRELALPLYDADLEAREGQPPGARRLKEIMIPSHGLLFASPEYNSSITAVLKNAIDWASRPGPDQPELAAFAGKVGAIMAASPGALGGLRGLVHLRSILGNIKVLVIPDQIAIVRAGEAFTEDGRLKDAKHQATVERIAARLVDVARRLHYGPISLT